MNDLSLLRQRQLEKESIPYVWQYESFGQDEYRIKGLNNPMLEKWASIVNRYGANHGPQVVELRDVDNGSPALYTPESPITLVDEKAELSVFMLISRPYDMGEPLFSRVVVSQSAEPTEQLLSEHPVLNLESRPSGPYIGESPLFYDEKDPDGWVTETDVVMSCIASANKGNSTRSS